MYYLLNTSKILLFHIVKQNSIHTNKIIWKIRCPCHVHVSLMTKLSLNFGSDFPHSLHQKLINLIQSCKTQKLLRQIQSQIIINAVTYQNYLVTSHFLLKCCELERINYARKVFDQIPNRRYTSLWNVMSKGYLRNDVFKEVMVLFSDMMRENVKPNCFTLPVVLKSCVSLLAVREGEQVHSVSIKNGFLLNTYVGTTLIELYSGGGFVERAYKVFNEMVFKNVVSWTAIIHGYVGKGDLVSARRLFDLAPERDVVLWNRMFTVYMELGNMNEARRLFDEMPNKDLMSYNTLLNGYSNNGDVVECERLFEGMHAKNIFSWNALIRGYAHNGRFSDVLDTFKMMLKESNVIPNDATLVNVLTACSRLGSLDFGKFVNEYSERIGYKANIYVCNALIDMYAKCGVMERANEVFNKMDKKDLISWNIIINALAVHGHGVEALKLFDKMKTSKEKPDCITFIGILCACSHMGLVKEGLDHFHSIINEYSIQPQIEHYGCVVDLLARVGLLDRAMEFVQKMPIKPDSVIWTALLAASRVHRKIQYAELSLQKLMELDPENPSNYVMLSNIYGEARKWEDLARLKAAMRDTGSKKVPGCSSIESEDGIVEFYCFDERHSRTEEIYYVLRGLTKLLRISECTLDIVVDVETFSIP